MNEYILAFDIGTSAAKTSLFGTDGVLIDSESYAHGTVCQKDGYQEQSPADWLFGIKRNTRMLIERNPEKMKDIAAIGVSGIMLGCLAVDINGEALGGCLIHSDHRAKKQHEELQEKVSDKALYDITGNISEARSTLCKIMWIRDNEPDIYKKTAFFIQAKDYVTSWMTKNHGISDFSDASHSQLMDIRKKIYAKDVIKEAGIDLRKLPGLYKSTHAAGTLSKMTASELGLKAGIPVACGCGDGPASGIGAGCVMSGDIYCCLGSTAWISSLYDEPIIDDENRVFNIISPDGEKYGIYGTVQSACTAVDWVMGILGIEDPVLFHTMAEEISPGADGLIFLPYINGERSPVFDSNAKGIFYGITQAHTRSHFARAALEGVAYALKDVSDVFCEKHPYGSLTLIGGGARSRLWSKIIADVTGLDIHTLNIPSVYSTSLGTAVIAGVAAGIYKSVDEARAFIKRAEEIRFDNGQHIVYTHYHTVYSKLYPAFLSLQSAIDSKKIL